MLKPVARNILLVAFGCTVAGCDTAASLPQAAKGYYGKETLGKLPESPDGADSSKVISLVQANGDMPQYRVKVNSNIKAGKTMSCEVKAGEIIDAIAESGSQFLVQAQRSSLTRDCENSGSADFVEGYIEQSVLELVAVADSDAGGQTPAPTPAQTVVTPLASPNPSATITPTPVPTQMPTMTAQCDSVKFANYPKGEAGQNPLITLARQSNKPNTIPGALWRAGGDNFLLLVKGSASKWKVQAFNKSDKTKMEAVTIENSSLKKRNSGEIALPLKKFVKNPNSWVGASIEVKITAIDSQGAEGSQSCSQKLNLLSPLVLDFSGASMVRTVPLVQSGVEFDLDADGTPEQVGWIDGKTTAFLTLDLNGNGRVDDGRELFGDATQMRSPAKASDGFEALAQYDSNADGRIDARDPAYAKLKLWFDRNGNGRSESNELVSLKAKKVSWIGLNAKPIARTEALQHTDSLVPNDVRLSAEFAAQGCTKGVCRVYDIFFGAVTNRATAQK